MEITWSKKIKTILNTNLTTISVSSKKKKVYLSSSIILDQLWYVTQKKN